MALPPGTYAIAADVETPGPGGSVASDTLVTRIVTLRKTGTVLLDARTGRLLQVAFDAPGAVQQQQQQKMICLSIAPVAPAGCENSIGDMSDSTFPYRLDEYRTPGRWTGQLFLSEGNWSLPARIYAAGHRYTDTLDAAVRGPATYFPEIQGGRLSYLPDNLFNEPSQEGVECCPRATMTLKLGHTTVRKATLSQWLGLHEFQVSLKRGGWYTLRVDAVRWSSVVPIPAGLLSKSESITWRFHVTPKPSTGNWQAFPATLTSFWPAGLNDSNQAAPGSVTPLTVGVTRAPNQDVPTPRYPFRTVAVQASFDGGATWHAVAVRKAGNRWQAPVTNPAQAGYVGLRSTVTDSHGDSTVETIYRAYAIS